MKVNGDRGIGIYSYIYADHHFGRENWIKHSKKGGDRMAPPSCQERLRKFETSILITSQRGETIDLRAPVQRWRFKGGGDTVGILSEVGYSWISVSCCFEDGFSYTRTGYMFLMLLDLPG